MLDQRGELLGSVHLARDITEHKRAEAALRESEARFKAVFEGAAIGIALKDLAGRYIQVNDAFLKMLGYDWNELALRNFVDITHPEDVQQDLEVYQKMISGGLDLHEAEKRYLCKDGKILWGRLAVSLIRNEQGEPQFFISMVEDITARKQAEEALRRLNAELEQRVQERTAELRQTVAQLQEEVMERQQAEAKIKKLNDELEWRVRQRTAQLQAANKELEAFPTQYP